MNQLNYDNLLPGTWSYEKSGRKVSFEELADLEARIGHTLPDSYKKYLVEVSNGGYPAEGHAVVGFIENGEYTETDFRALLGIENRPYLDLEALYFDPPEDFPKSLFPIGEDSFGNYFCISLTQEPVGSIWFANHEEEGFVGPMIAPNFEHFIASIKIEVPEDDEEPVAPQKRGCGGGAACLVLLLLAGPTSWVVLQNASNHLAR